MNDKFKNRMDWEFCRDCGCDYFKQMEILSAGTDRPTTGVPIDPMRIEQVFANKCQRECKAYAFHDWNKTSKKVQPIDAQV